MNDDIDHRKIARVAAKIIQQQDEQIKNLNEQNIQLHLDVEQWRDLAANTSLSLLKQIDLLKKTILFEHQAYCNLINHEKCSINTFIENNYKLENSEQILTNVHDPKICAGRPCTIHNLTNHNMRQFPQSWREDRSIMERVCPHGVGHPDPDSPWPNDSSNWIHGCDGCCI